MLGNSIASQIFSLAYDISHDIVAGHLANFLPIILIKSFFKNCILEDLKHSRVTILSSEFYNRHSWKSVNLLILNSTDCCSYMV